MASPTVPTSFVPHTNVASMRNATSGIADVLAYLAFVASGAIFLLAVGVFLYGRVLDKTKISEDAQLAKAVQDLNVATVPNFSRLHDRLTAGAVLLKNHVAFSGFFEMLDMIMPSTVRFSSVHIAFDERGIPKVDAAGTAKNFNSLALASSIFAGDSRFKGVLFSGIKLNAKDGSVSFALTGTLDPKTIAFTP